jgi:D-alanyl-D-alanine carboxypeptidase/D-alanyl-D-alanine-endopeptidase (penicillin-binding protein 4)
MYHDSLLFKPFYNSLPQAGLSGSMRNIGKGTFIEKNMRAKTGYISRARGYCGYVKTKAGKDLTFSILFNNYNCNPSEMKVKIETFLVSLADL